MSDSGNTTKPMLRLRPEMSTQESMSPILEDRNLDGPLIPHPRFISSPNIGTAHLPDISMNDYRAQWKKNEADMIREVKLLKATNQFPEFTIEHAIVMSPSIDMMRRNGKTDNDIEKELEYYYMGALYYLIPDNQAPPKMIEQFGTDWGLNARGIYYRHYYSPEWVTHDHDLWIPSLDGIHWSYPEEDDRRARARTFLKHVLDNEKWQKSEYGWEADAWSDVFGLMRNDPVLAVDKHEYNTIKDKRHPVSCLLAGEPKYIKRIPDATFGLATFGPQDYQNMLAEWDLDRDRLKALLLHRHCGLISDPQWGSTDLAFPFAVYEAKGWKGNAREARQQGCSAGAVYLDMLDTLGRQPGKVGMIGMSDQTAPICNNQVFVFTSFGAHWHILVGYKRPRLESEYAGCKGFSKSVYVFQRVWSGRVTTVRKAWELLSLIDQIHLWGVTDFRRSILQYLKQWHDFGRRCYANDVAFLAQQINTDRVIRDGQDLFLIPKQALQLANWSQYITENARETLRGKLAKYFREAYCRDFSALKHDWPAFASCVLGECGPPGDPGYPLVSREDTITHFRVVHGKDGTALESLQRVVYLLKDIREGDDPLLSALPKKRPASGGSSPATKRYRSSAAKDTGTSTDGSEIEVINLVDD